MSDYGRQALVARLLNEMVRAGSWAGRTHIQKTLYVFQKLFAPPAEWQFRYILYMHGPYSFELDRTLEKMEFFRAIQREDRSPYGSQFRTAEGATKALASLAEESMDAWLPQLRFVAEKVSTGTVRSLEALCTLMHIAADPEERKLHPGETEQYARLRELKPHLTDEEIERAKREYARLLDGARELPRAG